METFYKQEYTEKNPHTTGKDACANSKIVMVCNKMMVNTIFRNI